MTLSGLGNVSLVECTEGLGGVASLEQSAVKSQEIEIHEQFASELLSNFWCAFNDVKWVGKYECVKMHWRL